MLTPLSRWARYRSVGYLTGKGIVFGADQEIFPHSATQLGKFAIYTDVVAHERVDVCDEDLSVLADDSFDWVFVGKRLESMVDPSETLRQAFRKLKLNGHLLVFVPIAAEGATVAHQFTPSGVRALVADLGSWICKDAYEYHGWLLQVYKKVRGPKGVVDRKVSGKPRACIARYGALGDMVMATPLIRQLAEDGYEVTVNCTKYSLPVLDNNPYVSNIILQEKDAVPNPHLGEYWDLWASSYDRYINLSESIEGTLLKVEGRRDFFTHQSWRERTCNENYYDLTMRIGGYPAATGRRGELYLSRDEERNARRFREIHRNQYMVVWALNGSSHHKRYGLFEPVATDWLAKNPDALIVTLGDERAQQLEFDHPQVIRQAGRLSIRAAMALTKYADCVVGPESAIINAASCFDTPKIVLLSHSSHENLCKYWSNHICLMPDPEIAPCYGCSGCHQLHYSLESCPLTSVVDDSGLTVLSNIPLCTIAISGERLLAALDQTRAASHPN